MTLTDVPEPIRARLAEGLGQRPDAVTPMPCGDTCHGARIDVGFSTWFLKWTLDGPLGIFAAEAAGLKRLADAGLRVPRPMAWEDDPAGSFLLMEYITPRQRPFDLVGFGRLMGERIAELHEHTGPQPGCEDAAFLGILPLDNTPAERWSTFFAERRLRPLLVMAQESGTMERSLLDRLERFVDNAGKWLPDDLRPSLLHGNLMSTHYLIDSTASPVFIDPAVCYGDPELDIACARFMGGFPATFFETWEALRPPGSSNPMGHAAYNAWLLMWLSVEFGGRYTKDLAKIIRSFT